MRAFILPALLLAACAKPSSPPATFVSKSGSSALAAFDDTKPQRQESILSLAAEALRAGISLDGPRAERCWREEIARPEIRESCVLLWAGRGESSAELEEALVNNPSRILSLALLQRRSIIPRISWPGLLARIDSLARDPLWARAELAIAWLEAHGSPGLAEGEALLARIRPPEGSGPRDLASALKAIRRLRTGAWQDTLAAYCNPAAAEESRIRCWKVLSALGADGNHLHSLLPSADDDDWKLFSLSFPRFADRLRANLR